MSATPDTAAKILDAAAELFATHGYVGTSTRAIANLADVNEVTLFRRFENKLGILRALGDRMGGATASPPTDPTDTKGTLLEFASREIESSMRDGGVALRIAFDARAVPEVAELLGEGPRESFDRLAAYMAERQAAGDLRDDIDAHVLAEAFSSLTSSYVMYRMVMGVIDIADETETNVAQLFDLFWSGAAAKGA